MIPGNTHLRLATLEVMQAVIKRVYWDIAAGKEDAGTVEGIEALAEASNTLLKDVRANLTNLFDHA